MFILPVSKCLIENVLNYVWLNSEMYILYIRPWKLPQMYLFIRYSNSGTLGIGLFVFIVGTLELEVALKFNTCHSNKPIFRRSRYSTVCIVTRLRAGRIGARSPAGIKHFSLVRNIPTDSRAHAASYSMSAGVLYRGLSDRVLKVIAHLHLVSLCDSVVCWTGRTLPF